MRPLLLLAALLAFFSVGLNGGEVRADDIPPENAVEAGRDALSGETRYPWYDRENDSVRRITVAPPKKPEPQKTKQSNPTLTGTTTGPNFLGTILQGIGLALLIALLVAIGVMIARAALNREASGETGGHVVETSHDVDRVENLPFQVKRPTSDLLSEARRLYEAGQFSEAIIYLFSHQLVELDKHHFIRLTKGKTNRQYLRELRQRPALRGMLETTMIAFEDVFFGHHALDRERYEICWRSLESFDRELQRVEQAA